MNKVEINEVNLPILTYELLREDLNPIFDKRLDPYPYTMQNCRSSEITEKTYKSVIIENEFLKLTILPELGGRLYSAFDKIRKREMFYKNPVIKPRMVATRGAWFSGGVEFNFPISHSPNTMSRVNYTIQNFSDGSASVVFGNIEMMSQMHWKVELRLYPGKMYIEENVRLYNPASCENRFYFWTNAAVPENEHIKLIYPFDWCINFNSSEYIKWPYYNGVDCSNPSKLPSSFEVFGKLLKDKFFGIYDSSSEYGVIHYADSKWVKGAKFFTWGNDGRAVAWNKALTEDHSEYLEIQSGLFETQEVFKFMQPHQEIAWSEYWYPVSDTGGFKCAGKDLAFNYALTDSGMRFDLISTADLGECLVDINVNGTSQKTAAQFKAGIPVTICYNGIFTFEEEPDIHINVSSGQHRHVLCLDSRLKFKGERIDRDLYEDSRIQPDPRDNNKLFKKAVHSESLGNMEEAFGLYLKNLEENRGCPLTLNRLGRLYLKKDNYDEAQGCFREVLQYDNGNSEARYYYAAAEKEKGNIDAAYRIFTDISFGSQYFRASLLEMVKIDIILGYYDNAMKLLDSVEKNNFSLFLRKICIRKAGLDDRIYIILDRIDFKDEFIFAEQYLSCGGETAKKAFLDYINRDGRLLLGISIQYAELGLYGDAYKIIDLYAGNGIKGALLKAWLGSEGRSWNGKWPEAISKASLDYEFVNERLMARILADNCDKDMSGKLDYLFGNYRYWQGRKDDALRHFLSAYSKGLRYTVLLTDIGYVEYYYKDDTEAALKYLEEDIFVCNSLNEYSLIYLDRIYKKAGAQDKRKLLLPYLDKVGNRSWVINTIVDILKDAGMGGKALGILETEQFENWEGREVSGSLYREVILNMVKRSLNDNNLESAKEWIGRIQAYPENINYGESIYTCLSDVYYYKGLVYSLAGMEEEARREFRKGAVSYDYMNMDYHNACQEYSMKCIQELQKRL